MRVKKYLVNTMSEAMARIRTDLGAEAVILHTGRGKRGGPFGLLGRPKLEVIAAVDTDLQDFPQPTPAADRAIRSLQRELVAVKEMLNQVNKSQYKPAVGLSARLDDWYRRLLDLGVTTSLAQKIIQTVVDELSHRSLDNQDIVKKHLYWSLVRQLPSSTSPVLSPGQPHVSVIVGPSGVGKTTTVAKLAANFARAPYPLTRVLMITADTFRVGAIPQIGTFGEILGLPVETAFSPQQLAELVNNNRDYDLILVDTPGRSPRASNDIADLGDYLAAISSKTVHLAMAAGTRYEDMRQTVDVFSVMPLDGLIFTKVDETTSLGPAYTLTCETGLPLSYLTTGQHVPEDIEVATVAHVVDRMVGPTFGALPSAGTSMGPQPVEPFFQNMVANRCDRPIEQACPEESR